MGVYIYNVRSKQIQIHEQTAFHGLEFCLFYVAPPGRGYTGPRPVLPLIHLGSAP